MGKKILILTMFAAIISFADGLCVQLCVECSEYSSENPTCSKVDSLCGSCPTILEGLRQDSLAATAQVYSTQSEMDRKDSLRKFEEKKLAEIMQNNCRSDTCAFEITVNNGTLGHVRRKKGNKETISKIPPQKYATDSLLPPISEECRNFCETCTLQEKDSSNAPNPVCEKIELQCKCTSYAEQERILAEKAKADSVAAIKKYLNQKQKALISAKKVFGFCDRLQTQACSVMVKLKSESMFIIAIKDLSSEPIVEKNNVANYSASKKRQSSVHSDSYHQDSLYKLKTHPNPYMGVSFGYEGYSEYEVANFSVETARQWGLNLGFFWRLYFYKWGSFQMGTNVVYHHAEYTFDELYARYQYGYGSIDYQNIMLEIPLQARIGFPLDKAEKISPFISLSIHIRKPIYIWLDYDVHWSGSYNYYSDTYNDFYALSDWEFLNFIGFGIELNRQASFQWQFLPFSVVTNTNKLYNYCNFGGSSFQTWRFIVDISW